MKRSLFVLVISMGLSQSALASSDGYFCISENYVAYEVREWSAPQDGHTLRVVRVGGKEGIAEPVGTVLDDFQTHGMKCENDTVIVFGWDRKYTIDLKDGEGPKVGSVQPTEPGKVPADFKAKSFFHLGASIIDIPSTSADHRYELHTQSQEHGEGGVIYRNKAAKVVEKDLSGRITKEKAVYQAVQKETVD